MKRKIGNLFFVDTFLLLLITVLALINPPMEDGKITPKAEGMLTVEWSDKEKSDIDTWILAPNGDKLWFGAKDHGHMILHRDDLGITNDKIRFGTNELQIEQNIEVVDFVKFLDGEYIVNIQDYRHRDKEPVSVEVKLIILEPFATIAYETTEFEFTGQEKTLFSFTVEEGVVVKVNTNARAKLTR